MLTTIRYVLMTALRDRLFNAVLAGIALAGVLSAILGDTAFLENREMTLVYAAGASRVVLVLGLIVFACFHIRSAFDSKEIDVILSRPVSRASMVLAYWLGFGAVATLLLALALGGMAIIGAPSRAGFAAWAASMLLEAWLAAALALFAGFAMKSAVTAVLASLGFYALARMMAFFVMASESKLLSDTASQWMQQVLAAVSVVMPRLDLFARSEWLVYGLKDGEWRLFALQFLIYAPLLLVMTALDFKRKEF